MAAIEVNFAEPKNVGLLRRMIVPITKSERKSNPIIGQAGALPDAPSSRSLRRQRPSDLQKSLRLCLWRRFPLLTQLVRETRNFAYRISATLRARLFERGVDMGPEYQRSPDGSFQECNETRIRTSDTLRLYTDRPWLTCLDASLFVEGWNAGAQFGSRSPRVGRERLSAPQS